MSTATLELIASTLLWLAFTGLIGATVSFAHEWLQRREFVIKPQVILGVSGALLGSSVIAKALSTDAPLFTGSNQLIYATIATIALYFVGEYVLKFKGFGTFASGIAVGLLAIAQVIARTAGDIAPVTGETADLLNSVATWFHVSLIVFANVLFLVGAVLAVLYLYQTRALKTHSNSLISRRLPSLSNLEKVGSRAIRFALPFYVAGQLLGAIRAAMVSPDWWLDARIVVSGLITIVYLAYTVLYTRNKTSGQTTALIAVGGGVLVIILMVIARVLPMGFHIFGVVS